MKTNSKRNTWIILGVIVILISVQIACGGGPSLMKNSNSDNRNCQPTAVEVTNPPTNKTLDWKPAGTQYNACGIAIEDSSYTLYYSFQGGTTQQVNADTMLAVKFSDWSVKYFTMNDKGQLMMAE